MGVPEAAGILPPSGKLAQLLTRILVVLLWVGVMWAILGDYLHYAPVNLNTSPTRGSCGVGDTASEFNTSNATNGTSPNSTTTSALNSTTSLNVCQMQVYDNLSTFFWESAMMTGSDTVDELGELLDSGEQCNGTTVTGQCVLRDAIQALCPAPQSSSSNLRLFDIEKGHFLG